jgi:hypothetical protein
MVCQILAQNLINERGDSLAAATNRTDLPYDCHKYFTVLKAASGL